MRTILVTGFEPFGEQSVNASWLSVRDLPDEVEGVRIIKAQLPCVYFKSTKTVAGKLTSEVTDILLVGEAGGRPRITVELVGLNLDDSDMPDNAGVTRHFQRIDASGPDAYFATIPLQPLLDHLKTTNVPATLSYSAGLFVCNHTLFGVCHLVKNLEARRRVGFVHVPYTSEQAAATGTPGQSCSELTRGLTEIVTYLARNPQTSTNEWTEEFIY